MYLPIHLMKDTGGGGGASPMANGLVRPADLVRAPEAPTLGQRAPRSFARQHPWRGLQPER